jgi:hypothetical protein
MQGTVGKENGRYLMFTITIKRKQLVRECLSICTIESLSGSKQLKSISMTQMQGCIPN